MKLIAIKKECYAISAVSTTSELKRKYFTLCQGRDFRKRQTWEYVLKTLRTDGDWIGIRVSDIERLAYQERRTEKSIVGTLTFHPDRVDMDRTASNDD